MNRCWRGGGGKGEENKKTRLPLKYIHVCSFYSFCCRNDVIPMFFWSFSHTHSDFPSEWNWWVTTENTIMSSYLLSIKNTWSINAKTPSSSQMYDIIDNVAEVIGHQEASAKNYMHYNKGKTFVQHASLQNVLSKPVHTLPWKSSELGSLTPQMT